MFKVSALSFLILILVDLHYAFESGAPEDVCVDMKPKHLNAKPQLPPAPYKISVSKFSIGGSDKLDVTIEGTEVFKGFMLQCRNPQGVPVGKFENHPSGQVLNCAPGKDVSLKYLYFSTCKISMCVTKLQFSLLRMRLLIVTPTINIH